MASINHDILYPVDDESGDVLSVSATAPSDSHGDARLATTVLQRWYEYVKAKLDEGADGSIIVQALESLLLEGHFAAAGGARVVRDSAPAVHLVRQAKAAALPFAGLLQQMAPSDWRVVRRVEADAR